MKGLQHIRVVDFSTGIAGPYASKLLADAGADVIKVENEQGDWMRRFASTPEALQNRLGDSAFFQYLNSSKRSVTGSPADSHIRELLASADLVIEDFKAGSDELTALNIEQLRQDCPQVVVLSISPFGRSGPWAFRPATEFTVQAECGATGMRGLTSLPPYMAGGRISDFVTATYAAVTALASVQGALRNGQGEHIDYSMIEVMNIAATVYVDLVFSILGRPEMEGAFRQIETPSIEPTLDGYVGVNTNSRKHFDEFLKMIGKEDWLGDEELASHFTRQFRIDEWNEAVWSWSKNITTDEAIKQCTEYKVPVARVNNGKTVLHEEQMLARAVFEDNPAGDFKQPRPPYKINGGRLFTPSLAPTLGQHNGLVETRQPAAATSPLAEAELPLKGLRVLDATAWWAGPGATQMLGLLGADVIHVESVRRFDGGRTVVVMPSGDNWWEQSHLYNSVNTNKRGIALELDSEEGLNLFKELVKECDIVVENFAPRVFDGFGLTQDEVLSLNPEVVYVRMPAFGLDGPWRDNLGFAQTMEQMSGLAWLTGHPEDQPRVQRGTCDPVAGMHAAFAMLVALAEKQHSGKGQFLECTMIEGALNVAAEQVIEYTAYGNLLEREGNRSPYAAPQNLYPCQGEENWLALSIETDEQWAALVEFLGKPEWAQAEELQTHYGRRAAHDLIDEQLFAWAKEQQLEPLVEALVEKGIPAGTLLDSRFAVRHPQFKARGFFEEVTHPVIGTHPIPGAPFRFASRKDQPWISSHAPLLGQENHQVLKELLGKTEQQISELERQNIIGNVPVQ